MLSRNRTEYGIVFFGVAKTGYVVVNVSVLYAPTELTYVLHKADVEALIFEDVFADKIAAVLKDLPKIKARMAAVKDELEPVSVHAETGGGAVRVTANAQMNITRITIDQSMMSSLVDSSNADDRAMAEDLIAGAVNAALQKAKEAAAEKFGEAARELNLPIPAGGLGGLLG